MLLLYRYLINNYLKVLFLSIFSFITILLVSRLEEIAQFAALGARIRTLLLFTLYQIPYILPIAIPISCLISSLLLFQRLSHSRELTALRASGLSLGRILSPLLLCACMLSLTNFYITSELSTASHLSTRKMVYDFSSVNPLVLLQNAKIAKLKGAYMQMSPLRNGESAKDLLIAVRNPTHKRLNILLADALKIKSNALIGEKVALLSSAPADTIEDFDHLIIENQKEARSPAPELAKLLRKQGWKIANDHLKFKLLLIRMDRVRKEKDPNTQESSRILQKCFSDIVRRFSMGIAPLTFTLMGMAFGMEISRNPSKKGVLWVLFLAALTLATFFVAKELDHRFAISAFLFLFPHLLILLSSFWMLQRINRGQE